MFGMYRYITCMHNIADMSQIVQATSALMLPAVNERCRQAENGMFRCLGNVMFIGASKCGTTSLANHLGFHPGVEFIQRRMHIEVRSESCCVSTGCFRIRGIEFFWPHWCDG